MKKTLFVITGLTAAALGSHAIGVRADEPARPSRYEVHEIGFIDLNRPDTSGGWLSTVPPDTPLKGSSEWRARRAAVDMFAMAGPGAAGGARGNGGGKGRGNQPGGPAANRPPANPPANPPVPAPNMGGNGQGGGPAAPAPQPPPPWQGGARQGGQPVPNPAGPGAQPAGPNPGAPVPNPGGVPPRRRRRGSDARPMDPALLFYTDQPVTVSVRVGFQDGLPVAWWPKARPDGRDLVFKDVTIDPRLSAPRADALDTQRWPGLKPLAHFRAIGATPVKVGKAIERALVYEGALPFAPKIEVKRGEKGSWSVRNGGTHDLLDVLFIPAGERERAVLIGTLKPGAAVSVTPGETTLQALAGSTEMLLRATGLFPKEVTALRKILLSPEFMLDPGARVLARVPQARWDTLFPLSITPKPRQLLRVGVLRLFDAEHYQPKKLDRIPLAVTGGRRADQGGFALGVGATGR